MTPYYEDASVIVHAGDCLDVLRELPDASVDAVVTDPPYDLTNRTPDVLGCESCGRTLGGRDGSPAACPRCGGELTRQRSAQGKGFMGKAWDGTGIAFRPAVWVECLRVLRPGGHLLAFGGTRTSHRLACAVEDAGFEIRDSIAWLYGSGFPKSLAVDKAIDKAAGATREVVGTKLGQPGYGTRNGIGANSTLTDDGWYGVGAEHGGQQVTAPATDDARTWQGWGTALKPAHEPIVVARKPLTGTVAANVLTHGTGALNIDGCRVGTSKDVPASVSRTPEGMGGWGFQQQTGTESGHDPNVGRWPANVVLDESQAAALDAQSGEQRDGTVVSERRFAGWEKTGDLEPSGSTYGSSGGASRFFYTARPDEETTPPAQKWRPCWRGECQRECYYPETCTAATDLTHELPIEVLDARFMYTAKADARERVRLPKDGEDNTILAGSIGKVCTKCQRQKVNVGTSACVCPDPDFQPDPRRTGHVSHPTVKPLSLMRYLVRLVTPRGGTCLEPFAGSGTTVEACILEGFRCIAIEREADYLPLIVQRIQRRRDPVAAVKASGEDPGLFDLFGEASA